MHSIARAVQAIQEQVLQTARQCGRNPDEIRIVAVSKTHPPESVQAAFQSGMRIFGENRVQEAETKIADLHNLPIEWHLIGHLQTNKVKKAVSLFTAIHSVDSPKLIQALEREATLQNRTLPILLQLNLAGESSKTGADADELETLLTALRQSPHLQCRGLMTIPPFFDDPEKVRPFFRQLRELGERYRTDIVREGNTLELSMGMTHDFPIAIQEGATLIRIGTALFGNRGY